MIWNRSLIAIDIGTSAIKIAETTDRGRRPLRLAFEPLPRGAVEDGIIQNPDIVEQSLKRALMKAGISTFLRRAAICISAGSAIIKKLSYPPTDDQDNLREALLHEAEQHFQYDIKDLYFDYKILPNQDSSQNISIVLAGAKRDQVDQLISIVKSTGLKIGVIDCDIFALMNMMEVHYGVRDELLAVVDIGASSTKVVFVGGGEYYYTRVLPIGGNHYTEAISKELRVSDSEANKIKLSASNESNTTPQVYSLIKSVTDQLTSELKTTIEFFLQTDLPERYKSLKYLGLTGGCIKTVGLVQSIKKDLNCHIRILEPFNISRLEPLMKKQFKSQTHLMGVTAGLSARTFEYSQ